MDNPVSDAEVNLVPQSEFVLVKVDKEEEERTSSGIIVPVTVHANKKTQTGTIVAVGEGRRDPNDFSRRVPMDCHPGQRILFASYIGYPVTINGEEHLIIKSLDIMSLIVA